MELVRTCNETSLSEDSYQTNMSSSAQTLLSLKEIMVDCNKNGPHPMRVPIQVIVCVLGLPANGILLYVLLKNRKNLSPSEVLGLNFALLGGLYSLYLPVDIFYTICCLLQILDITQSFEIINYFGCPILLTCMCIERYVAVIHPVLYMKLRKWEYRFICSIIIWTLTGTIAVLNYYYTIGPICIPLSIIFNIMFLIMVACLLGIVCVLGKKGPGDAKSEDHNNSSVKKRAIKNILVVLVPSTVVYFPMLALVPFLMKITTLAMDVSYDFLCTSLNIFSLLPNFGVCIGPMFYLARVRSTLCGGNQDKQKQAKK